MTKWLVTSSTSSTTAPTLSRAAATLPPVAFTAGRPSLIRGRSGSLTALDKPPTAHTDSNSSNSSSSNDTQPNDMDDDDSNSEALDDGAIAMRAAAMAIPQFRSCRVAAASIPTKLLRPHNNPLHDDSNNIDNHADSIDLRVVRRRRRSVSDNSSSCSTTSTSSTTSFSLRQLSADVSAFRSDSIDSNDSLDGFAISSPAASIQAPVLPQPPYPVDPYHVYCLPHIVTSRAIAAITQALQTADVAQTLHVRKCKFTCVKYVHYSHVEFIVRVYRDQNDVLLIESQRRSGSLLLWDGLYTTLIHALCAAAIVDLCAPQCRQSGGQKRVGVSSNQPPRERLSAQIWQTLVTQTPSSGVDAMQIMLLSKFTDAQREGCAGVAVLTEDPASALLVVQHGLVEPLVVAADAVDFDMARCAIGALANIATAIGTFGEPNIVQETRVHIAAATAIVVELLAKTNVTPFALELVRECARALGAFSSVCPSHVVAQGGVLQLERLAHHRDAQLAANCRAALATLGIV